MRNQTTNSEMNETTDEIQIFDRIGKKQKKTLTLSRELCGALDELVDDRKQSESIERAVWQALVNEHGEDVVRAAVEDVQDGLDASQKLGDSEPYTLPA